MSTTCHRRTRRRARAIQARRSRRHMCTRFGPSRESCCRQSRRSMWPPRRRLRATPRSPSRCSSRCPAVATSAAASRRSQPPSSAAIGCSRSHRTSLHQTGTTAQTRQPRRRTQQFAPRRGKHAPPCERGSSAATASSSARRSAACFKSTCVMPGCIYRAPCASERAVPRTTCVRRPVAAPARVSARMPRPDSSTSGLAYACAPPGAARPPAAGRRDGAMPPYDAALRRSLALTFNDAGRGVRA